ncbi:hypothetical protein Ocin01_01340 [Orchesella cincta]|uniref:Uncharacterized protein n=1 Tax=Orchesella cincta TaxID=48709 RepID=A0A1D2NJC1_ORCCI|nr:hypothetical protein Ocin01_01340 [Orchesella cincta]
MTDENSKITPSKRPSLLTVHFHSTPNVRFTTNSDPDRFPSQEPQQLNNVRNEPSTQEVQILVYPRGPDAFEENMEDFEDPSASKEPIKEAKSEGFSILIKLVNAMYPAKAPKDPDPVEAEPISEDQEKHVNVQIAKSDGLSIIGKVAKKLAPIKEKVDIRVGTSLENIDSTAQTSELSLATFSTQTSRQNSLNRSSLQNSLERDLNTSTQTSKSSLHRTSTIEAITRAISLYEARKAEADKSYNEPPANTLTETGSQYEPRNNKSFSLQTDPERDVTGTQTTSDLKIRDASDLFLSQGKVNDTSSQQTDDVSLRIGTTQTSADISYSSKGNQVGRKMSSETLLDQIPENGECPKCELIMRMILMEGERLQNDPQFLDMVEKHKLSHLQKVTKEKYKLKMWEAKIDQLNTQLESFRTHRNGSQNDLPQSHSECNSDTSKSILSKVAKIITGINRLSHRLACENNGDTSKRLSHIDSSETLKPQRKGRSSTSNCHLGDRKASKECSEEIITRKYYHRGGGCGIRRSGGCNGGSNINSFDREERKCHDCYCNCDRYQRKRRDSSIDDVCSYNCPRRPQTSICEYNMDRCDRDDYKDYNTNRRLCSTACESRRSHDEHGHYHKGNEYTRRLVPKLVEFISETAKLLQNAKEAKERDLRNKIHSKQPEEKVDDVEFHEIKSPAKAELANSSQPQESSKEEKQSSALKGNTFKIIPSPAQKDKEKVSQKEAPDGGSPVEAANSNSPQGKGPTNGSDGNSDADGGRNKQNGSSHCQTPGNGFRPGKINIEDPELRQLIGEVLSAISESQEEDEFCSSDFNPRPCSRESSCAAAQRCRTAPPESSTEFQCGTTLPRICSYFYPICFNSPSQCQDYCGSTNPAQNCVPLQESFQQNNTVCLQRVQWREQCLMNSRQNRQAQQAQNQQFVERLRRCPPSTTGATQRGLRRGRQQLQQCMDACEAITYVVPPHRQYWKSM